MGWTTMLAYITGWFVVGNGSADCSDTTIAKLHEFFDHTGIAGANGAAHLLTRDAPKSERADSARH